jgi:hypothetical protein
VNRKTDKWLGKIRGIGLRNDKRELLLNLLLSIGSAYWARLKVGRYKADKILKGIF